MTTGTTSFLDRESSGAWATFGSIPVVAQLATRGFDWVCLDAQHGAFDRSTVLSSLSAAQPDWCGLFVRVSANDAAEIGWALDSGADVVIVPMVNSAADARAAVAAAKYPPLGQRSWGPLAPLSGRAAPTVDQAAEGTRLWVMIETADALAALEQILDVPGVDGIFVGPFDLSLSLGTTVDRLLTDPATPLRRVVTLCNERSVPLCAYAGNAENAGRLRALGFAHLAIASDLTLLQSGIGDSLHVERGPRNGY